jgi:hypothetical protein
MAAPVAREFGLVARPTGNTKLSKEPETLQQVLEQLAHTAAQLANPTWRAELSKEKERQILCNMQLAITTVRDLRGHIVPSSSSAAGLVWASREVPPFGSHVGGWHFKLQTKEDANVTGWNPAVEGPSTIKAVVEPADATKPTAGTAPAAPSAQRLHPTHVIWYNKALRPVHTGAREKQFVFAEGSGKRVYVKSMAASTRATLARVAPFPVADTIQALKATPTGTFLLYGIDYHAVFEGPQGGEFVIVAGKKRWVKQAANVPVRLLLTELDRAAMTAAV